LKCHYLAAFTAALLNNQPMGFYSPATIVKDAQRHGLRLLPIDVTKSEWNCTLEKVPSTKYRVPRETVASCQYPVSSDVVGRSSLVVGPENFDAPAAKRRQNTAHGASREEVEVNELAPEGRKNLCDEESIALRMGLRYVRGLREEAAKSLLRERILSPFTSIHDLTRRVPELRRDELTTLAEIGALNSIGNPPRRHGVTEKSRKESSTAIGIPAHSFDNQNSTINNSSVPPCLRGENNPTRDSGLGARNSGLATRNSLHRRDALWHVEAAVRTSGSLLEQHAEPDAPSPLARMTHEERLVTDFHGTGLTVGPHPMSYKREWLNAMGIRRASELRDLPTGKRIRIGGCVITRQRPGTAKGFVFLSLEDETGVANAIVRPDLFHENRLLLTSERFLAVEGILQNQDNVISVRAERVQPLFVTKAETSSHDFH
jgi:DNA polymerase III alpha subunit